MKIISFVDDLDIDSSSTSMEILQNIIGHLELNFLDPNVNNYYFSKDDIEIFRVKSLNNSHVHYPNISYEGLTGTELQLVEFISTQGGIPDLTTRIADSPISICQIYFNYIGVQMDEMSSLDILDITYTEDGNSCTYSGQWQLHDSFPIAHGKGTLTKRILHERENIEVTYDTAADIATLVPLEDGTVTHDGISSWKYIRSASVDAIPTRPGNKRRAFDPAKDLDNQTLRNVFKFTTVLQGGFDGLNIFNEDSAKMNNTSATEEMNNTNRGLENGPTVAGHRKAIAIMENTADVDIKLLAIPGIRNAAITDEAIEAVKNRFDALYIMDIENYDNANILITSSLQTHNVGNTVKSFKNRALDTSFSACYYPDVMYDAADGEGEKQLPASVGALGAYSYNDRVGFEWFAPAGLSRGIIQNATLPTVKLSKKNQQN